MEDPERNKVIRRYKGLWSQQEPCHFGEEETEEILDPFKFKFENMKDLWTFCEEKRGYTSYTEVKEEVTSVVPKA